MKKIKAVILDLDGTLLDDDKKISDKTIDFLKSIKNDIKIILASARQISTIKPYLNQIDILDKDNYTICFNGSLVVNNEEDIIFSSYIGKDVLNNIDSFILENNIKWTYYLYDNRLLRNDIIDLNMFINQNKIYKIVGVSATEEIQKIKKKLPKYILDNLEITSSEENRIEFVAKGMTKVKAIEMLLNKLNIRKEEIIAIGDGDNDIEMIKYAGIGIAMLNAPDIVKKHADIITKYSNNNDGIYDVLKNVLKNGVRYYNEL